MEESERDKLAQETHQALLGIPGTEDKGVVGDVKEIKADLKLVNSRVTVVETKQEERNRPSKKAVGGYGAAVVGIMIALWKAFTNGS